jgi:hypothetical protein
MGFAGFVLVVNSSGLPSAYKAVAGVGLVSFNIAIILFFLVQRFQIASWVGRCLGNSSLGLAALIIRRSREIVWILTGLGIWWWYSLQPGFSGVHEQTLG